MPPKKKKGKGKKGKAGKEGATPEADGAAPAQEETLLDPSDREKILQAELDDLSTNLHALKKEVDVLRKENEFLQQEAQQTRVESHDYMSYMAKKTHKRQTTIISLSDQNEKELEKINRAKEEMLKDFDDKKGALRRSLLEKENELAKARKEFTDLAEYQELREDQLKQIKQLEREVVRMRSKHSESIQQLKAKFLQEKSDFASDSDERVRELTREANKKAVKCLDEHATGVKHENRLLRAELLELIRRGRVLSEHKKQLEAQQRDLVREKQYSNDIRRLRCEKQKLTTQKLEAAQQSAGT